LWSPIRNESKAREYADKVDRGEAEAIALAEELHADYLLIDERKGRQLARASGITVIGLVGIVLMAKRSQLIPSAKSLIKTLREEAGIYLTEEVEEAALKSVGEYCSGAVGSRIRRRH